MITNKPFKKRICYFLRRKTGRETYKEEFIRKNKIKTEEDLYRYIQNHKPANLSLFTGTLSAHNDNK